MNTKYELIEEELNQVSEAEIESANQELRERHGKKPIDPLYDQAVSIVLEYQKPSMALLQRLLEISYNRAEKLMIQMEINGIVSPLGRNYLRRVLGKSDNI